MSSSSRITAVAVLVAALLTPVTGSAQFDPATVIGAYYKVQPTFSIDRLFSSVEVQRIAPGSLAPPPPFGPLDTRIPLQLLTGQIFELPERHRIYFAGIDGFGSVRLLELDFFGREIRIVNPPPGRPRPTALAMVAPADGNKLYVEWWGPGAVPQTDIYDSETLAWLGSTISFRPDERAWGFEHKSPYLWTIGPGNRVVLVDTQMDAVVGTIVPERWFGPTSAVVADAWHDLVLFRLAAGSDRYQLVDVESGEMGAAVDVSSSTRNVARLALNGRVLVLLAAERGPVSRYTRRRISLANGSGSIFDMEQGEKLADFNLALPPDVPTFAVGIDDDPAVPGRLWVHALGDRQRFDFDYPDCRRPPKGDRIDASLELRFDPTRDQRRYSYTLAVDSSSAVAAGALALEAGRAAEEALTPAGWGVDALKGGRWIRWTNGLGPAEEDVAPGTGRGGFDVVAAQETRPGIGEYRIRAALGTPRGCESDDRFLKNSLAGFTLVPELVTTTDPKRRAKRLKQLVGRACDIGWINSVECRPLRAAADQVERRRDRESLRSFDGLVATSSAGRMVRLLLADASASVGETIEP